MAINFPLPAADNELFVDGSGTTWICIDADLANSQVNVLWARKTQTISNVQIPIRTNYIINPTFFVNQRAFAGGALADTVYGFDRWKAGGASNMTLSGVVLTIVSGTVVQVVEDFDYTGNVTVSWVGTSTVNSGNTSPYTYTKVAGNDTLTFSTGTLSEVKMEIGSDQTPFEYPDLSIEQLRSFRYYEISRADEFYNFPQASASQAQEQTHRFTVPKRISPSMGTVKTAGSASTSVFSLTEVKAGGFRAKFSGDINNVIYYSWSANAEL